MFAATDQPIRDLLSAGRYREAFELILDCCQGKVYRLCCAMLADDTLAEDVCQDALLRVWRALPGYRGEASVSTWIYAITRNTCLTRLQQNAAHLAVPLTQALLVAERPRAGLEIRDLIQRLPEKYRRVLVLFYFEDKSYQEVAAMLDLPVGTVKTYLHRARKELAVALAPRDLEVSNGLRRV